MEHSMSGYGHDMSSSFTEKPPLPYGQQAPAVYNPPLSRHHNDRFAWYGVGLGGPYKEERPVVPEDRTPAVNFPPGPPNYNSTIAFGAISIFCCCFLGVPGLIFAIMASKANTPKKASQFNMYAVILIVSAFVMGILSLMLVLTFLHLNLKF
jgi:hypothetical protein